VKVFLTVGLVFVLMIVAGIFRLFIECLMGWWDGKRIMRERERKEQCKSQNCPKV